MKWTRTAQRDGSPHRYYSVTGLHPEISEETVTGPAGVVVFHQPHMPAGAPHDVAIPEEAIADRMAFYGLTTEEEAINHIMWEHHIRLNPDHPESVLPLDVKANFDRVWGPGHKAARGKPMTPAEQNQQNRRHAEIRRGMRGNG